MRWLKSESLSSVLICISRTLIIFLRPIVQIEVFTTKEILFDKEEGKVGILNV